MLQTPGFAFTVLSFLLVIGPLVFVHELGHYLVGRWCGVKAEVFSIGFGRELFGWSDRRGTRWKVGWLPLGGYVKFAGDMNAVGSPSEEWLALPAEERARTYQAKALWQRFLIVAAGPVTNFLFAILLFMGLYATYGQPTAAPVVRTVVAGSPAERAGILPGDRIVSIDGAPITGFEQVMQYVMFRPEQRLAIVVERGAQRVAIAVTTRAQERTDEFGNHARIGMIGVTPSGAFTVVKVPITQLPAKAVGQTIDTIDTIIVTMKQLVVGQRSVKELGGPLKIAQVSGQQASLGWAQLFALMALISINLGFINLLPIPMLDGGHLFFYLIEGIRRRPLKPEAQEWAFKAGLAALLALMIMVTLNDLTSFGLWTRLGGLIG